MGGPIAGSGYQPGAQGCREIRGISQEGRLFRSLIHNSHGSEPNLCGSTFASMAADEGFHGIRCGSMEYIMRGLFSSPNLWRYF